MVKDMARQDARCAADSCARRIKALVEHVIKRRQTKLKSKQRGKRWNG
jgi:hypothetical protein